MRRPLTRTRATTANGLIAATMKGLIAAIGLVVTVGLPPAARAQGDELDESLFDFDEVPLEQTETETERRSPSWLDFQGDLGLLSGLNFAHKKPVPGLPDQRGLNHLMARLHLEAKLDLPGNWRALLAGHAFYDAVYAIKGRDDYPDELLDDYEWEAEPDELWLRGSLGRHLDLKLGRQIVSWGSTDNIRVTDVLNPLDGREPGMVDIKDLKLPVAMTRLDCYFGAVNLTGILVHETRFNKNPAYGSDFFPGTAPLPPEEELPTSLDNLQYALAVDGTLGRWDLSLYGAWIFDDRPTITMTPDGPLRTYSRLTMQGAAACLAQGNWLLKGETAFWQGLEFSSSASEKFTRLDLLVGAEYSGLSETIVALELVDRHLLDYAPEFRDYPEDPVEDDIQLTLRMTREFMHDRLRATFLVMALGLADDAAGIGRVQCDYEWRQALIATAGLVLYQSGDRFPYENIGDNDRLFVELEYSF